MVNGYNLGSMSDTQTLNITSIPRASNISSISSTFLGEKVTVFISSKSSSFRHRLWYKVNNGSWVDIGSSTTFTPSLSYASLNTNGVKNTLNICLRTYSGNTQIGDDEYKVTTINTPKNSSTLPSAGSNTILELYQDVLNSGLGVYLQGWSVIKISNSGASAKLGASIVKKEIFFNDKIIGYGDEKTISFPDITGDISIYTKVTDSRGFTSSTPVKTIHINKYEEPNISNFHVFRNNGGSGDKVNVVFTSKMTKIGTNKHNVKIWFIENGKDESVNSNWIQCYNNSFSDSIVTKTLSLSNTFDLVKSYKFWIQVYDSITSDKKIFIISTAKVILAYGRNSVGIGMIPSETPGTALEIGGTVKIFKNGGDSLELHGQTHTYQSMYVNGERKAWFGFGDVGSQYLTVKNEYTGKQISLKKDGNLSYNGAAEFDDVLIGNHSLGSIGNTIWGSSTGTSVLKYSWTNHRTLTLQKGIWIVDCGYIANQSGKYLDYEVAGIQESFIGGVLYCQNDDEHISVSSGVIVLKQTTTLTLRAWSNNGMTSAKNHYIKATKLVDIK